MSIFVYVWGSICFFRIARICLSRVQPQLSGWLLVFADFKRIFMIPAVHKERRRCAPLQQPGSFKHGVAQSDIFLHILS